MMGCRFLAVVCEAGVFFLKNNHRYSRAAAAPVLDISKKEMRNTARQLLMDCCDWSNTVNCVLELEDYGN